VNLADAKVVHFIRHGEAEHNVAARIHGCQEYRNWAYLDAPLTEKGREQAREARKFILAQMKPQVVLVSPLTRTLQTAEEVFEPLTKELKFEVWEGVRERIGHHPCDKRRNVTELKSKFPQFSFNSVQDEEDCLWSDAREPTEDLLQRARTFLDALRQRSENCIGVVSHSAFLTAVFVALTEGGLTSPDGPPDIHAASSPDASVGPSNGEASAYFTNGEVKSVVMLPLP